jgi:hypothetical protein
LFYDRICVSLKLCVLSVNLGTSFMTEFVL